MKHLLFIVLILPLQAKWTLIEGSYTQMQASSVCEAKQLRLPHIYELFALKGDSSYPKGYSYWSATTLDTLMGNSAGGELQKKLSSDQQPAYSFYLQDGDITISPKSKKIHILCTDTPFQQQVSRSFTLVHEGIIDDDLDLLWHHITPKQQKEKYSYQQAIDYCEELDDFDLTWRLPTLNELFSLVEYRFTQPAINSEVFTHTMQRYYWSSTPFGTQSAYVVGFKLGSVATSATSNESYIRCVSEDIP